MKYFKLKIKNATSTQIDIQLQDNYGLQKTKNLAYNLSQELDFET